MGISCLQLEISMFAATVLDPGLTCLCCFYLYSAGSGFCCRFGFCRSKPFFKVTEFKPGTCRLRTEMWWFTSARNRQPTGQTDNTDEEDKWWKSAASSSCCRIFEIILSEQTTVSLQSLYYRLLIMQHITVEFSQEMHHFSESSHGAHKCDSAILELSSFSVFAARPHQSEQRSSRFWTYTPGCHTARASDQHFLSSQHSFCAWRTSGHSWWRAVTCLAWGKASCLSPSTFLTSGTSER